MKYFKVFTYYLFLFYLHVLITNIKFNPKVINLKLS